MEGEQGSKSGGAEESRRDSRGRETLRAMYLADHGEEFVVLRLVLASDLALCNSFIFVFKTRNLSCCRPTIQGDCVGRPLHPLVEVAEYPEHPPKRTETRTETRRRRIPTTPGVVTWLSVEVTG